MHRLNDFHELTRIIASRLSHAATDNFELQNRKMDKFYILCSIPIYIYLHLYALYMGTMSYSQSYFFNRKKSINQFNWVPFLF